jgi:hypothetical protein
MPLALRISAFDGVNKNVHELLLFEHAPRGLYLKIRVTMGSLSRYMHLVLVLTGREISSPNLVRMPKF